MQNVVLIGGGPAALLLAARLDTRRYRVTLCEQKKTVGRKFLVAGEGGLNLTYAEPVEALIARYSPAPFMAAAIRQFDNEALRQWLHRHGVPTFVGTSKRVFPEASLKPFVVLNRLVAAVEDNGVKIRTEMTWTGWTDTGALQFANGEIHHPDVTVFALGGASWRVTGSDGAWRAPFVAKGIEVHPFRAANCAFAVQWSEDFITAHAGKPLKNITLTYQDQRTTGELTVTQSGLEGNAIYPLSQKLQRTLYSAPTAEIYLDLKPTLTLAELQRKYEQSSSSKVTATLKNDLRLDRTAIALLKQASDRATFLTPDLLLQTIKALPLTLHAPAPLDEAISTLGGIALDEIDPHFQLNQLPHTYAIGEMLDWYAPTGGYLLQGCFSMGAALAHHLNALPPTPAGPNPE